MLITKIMILLAVISNETKIRKPKGKKYTLCCERYLHCIMPIIPDERSFIKKIYIKLLNTMFSPITYDRQT